MMIRIFDKTFIFSLLNSICFLPQYHSALHKTNSICCLNEKNATLKINDNLKYNDEFGFLIKRIQFIILNIAILRKIHNFWYWCWIIKLYFKTRFSYSFTFIDR